MKRSQVHPLENPTAGFSTPAGTHGFALCTQWGDSDLHLKDHYSAGFPAFFNKPALPELNWFNVGNEWMDFSGLGRLNDNMQALPAPASGLRCHEGLGLGNPAALQVTNILPDRT